MTNMINAYLNYIVDIITHNPDNAQIIIFLIAFVESFAILGSIFPGTLLLTPVGIMLGSGCLPFSLTVSNILIGAFLGDFISYLIGYHFHRSIERSSWVRKQQKTYDWFKYFITKHGMLSLLIGRFVGPLRSSVPLFAGLFGMRPVYFIIGIFPSIIAWSIVYLGPGYIVGQPSVYLYFMEFMYPLLYDYAILWCCIGSSLLLSYFTLSKHTLLSTCYRHILQTISLLLFLIILKKHGTLKPLDTYIFNALYQSLPSVVSEWISNIFNKKIIFPLMTFFIIIKYIQLNYKESGKKYYAYLIFMLGATALVPCIKLLTHTPRPLNIVPATNYLELYSFPSGHTTTAAGLCILITYFNYAYHKKYLTALLISIPIVLLTGCARMSLGYHWFSDILAGCITGYLVALIAISVHKITHSHENIHWSDGMYLVFSLIVLAFFFVRQ